MNNQISVKGVPVHYWNPRLHTRLRYITYGPRRNNFGDMLGPVIVSELTPEARRSAAVLRKRRLLAVGSILHFARNGDVIWGSGRNGKIADHWHRFSRLDVRAVRGPLTAEFLSSRGIQVPQIYGDPALLLPLLFPDLILAKKTRDLIVVPNLHDAVRVPDHLRPQMISPTAPWRDCVRAISESRFVVSSSLHGKVIADALKIPSRLVRSEGETSTFKYDDYFLGTGREPEVASASFDDAVHEMPGKVDISTNWSPEPLLQAFPHELWR